MATLTTTTVDDALLQTLRVRGRLHEPKLIFFTQLRHERDTKSKRPTVVAVKKALAKLVTARKVVKLEGSRYELGSKAPPVSAKPKKKPKREPLPAGRCFFPVVDPEILAKVRARIEKRFEVVAKTDTSISFRGPAGSDFRLQLGERKEAIRRMKPIDKRAMEAHLPKFSAFLVLLFDDVDLVLDEANALIEAQGAIVRITKGPMFNAWNRTYIASP